MFKQLRAFAGCKVGEERLQLLYMNNIENKIMSMLVNKGFLQITRREQGRGCMLHRWFALTEKGKIEVSKRFEQI